ncbi:hypothetical protein C6Y62_10865 [Hyphomicrobium sulfonivorans]|nr:hypothetical protein [Hyphomicrobium sulfonivorans]
MHWLASSVREKRRPVVWLFRRFPAINNGRSKLFAPWRIHHAGHPGPFSEAATAAFSVEGTGKA